LEKIVKMNGFDEPQELGNDFVFESDPNSLQRILDNRELSPRSVLAMRMSSKLIKPTLSPANSAPKHVRENPERYDFFESKKGDVFWRPKTPKSGRTNTNNSCVKNNVLGGRQRALGRKVVNALPQRMLPSRPAFNDIGDPRTTMSSRKPLVIPNRNANKGRRSCMPALITIPPPRHSISERKAVPGLDNLPTRLPKSQVSQGARKELNFEEAEGDKENNKARDFEFAKPLPVQLPSKEASTEEKKSLAKMIMLRESLAGLPRASLSGLFRQSLSIAELDRMFDDDSTQSFEDLERRLKTPGKKPATKLPRTPRPPPQIKMIISAENHIPAIEVGIFESPAKTVPSLEMSTADKEQQGPELMQPKIDNKDQEPQQRAVSPQIEAVTCVTTDEEVFEEVVYDDDNEVEKIELFEYELDDSSYPDEEFEQRLLQKSMSMLHLSICDEATVEEEKFIVLAKSSSLTDLSSLEELEQPSSLFRSALESLKEHRQEQAAIDMQIQSLMERSLKRREQFRAVWGVSPRSINQKRDLKTAINVQNVTFSGNNEVNEDAGGEEDDSGSEIASDFGDAFFGEPVAENLLVENDVGIELSFSAPVDTDVFQQYIEANFPENGDISYAAHNFTGIELTANALSLDEIFVDPIQSPIDAVETRSDGIDLQTPDITEGASSPPSMADPKGQDNLDDVEMEMELNIPPTPAPVVLKKHNVEQEVMETESLFAAARAFKNEMALKAKKPKRKSVRFLNATPDKSNNTSMDEEEDNTMVQVRIGNIAFNEGGNCSSVVHTPVPKHHKFRMSNMNENEEQFLADYEKTPPLPTPMAMRDISIRAQQSLAQLYDQDEEEDGDMEEQTDLAPQALFTGEDDSYEA
jgi:hypothetical protein